MKGKAVLSLLLILGLSMQACGCAKKAETSAPKNGTTETEQAGEGGINAASTDTSSETTPASEEEPSEESSETELIIPHYSCEKITKYSEGKVVSVDEHFFDENDNEIRYNRYDRSGDLTEVKEYEYDGNNNKTSECSYKDGKVSSRLCYEYDNQNRLVYLTYYDKNDSIEKTVEYEYDSKGNRLSELIYDKDGNLTQSSEWEYNSDNLKISYTKNAPRSTFPYEHREWDSYGNVTCDITGAMRTEYRNEYDNHGNLIKIEIYDNNDELYSWEEYEYDQDNNLVYRRNNQAQKNDRSLTEYDKKGNKIRYEHYINDELYSWEEYEYDVFDRKIRYSSDSSIVEYEYDIYGNLIQTTYYNENHEVTNSETHEYTYV